MFTHLVQAVAPTKNLQPYDIFIFPVIDEDYRFQRPQGGDPHEGGTSHINKTLWPIVYKSKIPMSVLESRCGNCTLRHATRWRFNPRMKDSTACYPR